MAEEGKPSTDGSASEGPTPSGGRTASEFRDVADDLRKRVDLFGKTLAALATTATAAVGLNKIGDLFPMDGNEGWAVAACGSLAAAALAAIWIAVRLMMVAQPVVMGLDPDSTQDLSQGERDEVRPIYKEAAERFGYTSLAGLHERERSLRNAASRTSDEDERARRTALADAAKTEIESARARSQVAVIRRRSTNAVSDPLAWFLYAVVIGGLIAFAIGTDKISSERTDPVAEAKACGDARKAGATTQELGRTNGVCEGKEDTAVQPQPPTAAEARAQITAELVKTLQACAALVQKRGEVQRPLKNEHCDPVREAVAAMDPASR